MRFNLISNLTNGAGLQQDYLQLRRELESRGHHVEGVQFNAHPFRISKADVNIFLEVVAPAAFPYAKQQWAVPNPEWWFKGWSDYTWHLVLAKTKDCQRLFTAIVGDRCRYLGWTARDLYDPAIGRQRKFLHVQGKSKFKNTAAVKHGAKLTGVPLTVVAYPGRVSDDELKRLMNSHFCQVMPSAYEGFGQVLHESLAVGQILITTNAPPMNEIEPAVLVPSASWSHHHLGRLHTVRGEDVAHAMRKVMDCTDTDAETWSKVARAHYQRDEVSFRQNLGQILGDL